MTAKEPYSYVVLRYIHDVLTGEFVNVGLVMVVPGRPLILTKSRKTFGRIKNVFPDLDSESYKRAIEAIDRGMKSVQPVGAGLTADPQKTFDQLYLRFVTRYDRPSERRRSDDDVWRPVEAKLKEHGVNVELEPKRIQGNTDAVEFRHAWKNGRWHVYEPLSFDLSDADNIKDKARRWLGHLSAVKIGTTEDVQVHFIVGRPQNTSLEPAYRNAVEILRQVPFDNKVFDEEQIEDFVNQIEDEVRHHEGRTLQ